MLSGSGLYAPTAQKGYQSGFQGIVIYCEGITIFCNPYPVRIIADFNYGLKKFKNFCWM